MTWLPLTVSTERHRMHRVLLGGVLFLCSIVAASVEPGVSGGAAAETQPLHYKIAVSKTTVCPHEAISLELELQNTSGHKVLIDQSGLVYSVSISRNGGGMGSTGDRMGRITTGQLVSLEAGKSFKRTVPYPLQGDFFSVVGSYRIHVSYGQFSEPSSKLPELFRGVVESNTVEFQIKNCR